jgi:hypothetical protein
VNRSELNWLLQTIKSAEMAERFLLAQYERGRISLEVMADVARETGMDQPHLESNHQHGGPGLERKRNDGTTGCYCLRGVAA